MTESGIRIIKHADLSKEDLKNPISILGMPGIADIGKFALDSLIGQLDAKNFMDFIFLSTNSPKTEYKLIVAKNFSA